jgi:DNA topoisomerase IB
VLALGLTLVDRGYFRAGGEQYAEDNDSYGLATLRCDHARVRGDMVSFDYPAKSGVQRALQIENREVARAVRALLRRPQRTDRLLAYRNSTGWADVHAEDVNDRFKELVGDEYSVKDLRTWHGTVLAAQSFALADPAVNVRVGKKVTAAVMKEVAESLGNTPAVARSAYVDPRVIRAYEQGSTIAAATRRASKARRPDAAQDILDKATRSLVHRAVKHRPATEVAAAA